MRRAICTTAGYAALLACAAPIVRAQAIRGRLEGTIIETSIARPLTAVSISLIREEFDSTVQRTTHPDSTGRFHIDSLVTGKYILHITSSLLDSLGLVLPEREVSILAAQTSRFDYTLPSGSALRDAMCTGLALGKGRGVVAGRAFDARNDSPLEGAKIVVSWSDIAVDSALSVNTGPRIASVKSDPYGAYRLCGVPTGNWLTIQLQVAGHASSAVRVSLSDEEGAIARDLSLNTSADSAAGDLIRTGTARVTGFVRGAGGYPLANAEVSVQDARGTTSTDALGKFSLNGLPDGTQILVTRRLGYALAELQVELRAGRTINRDIQLSRIASLDTVVVSEYRTRYREFFFNRSINMMAGDFLTAEMIARRTAEETGDLVDRMPGFNVVGHGAVAKVFTNKATLAQSRCEANVVVDGVEQMGVNDVAPSQVQGIETYVSPPLPSAYHRKGCGLVVIWTTRWRRPTKPH